MRGTKAKAIRRLTEYRPAPREYTYIDRLDGKIQVFFSDVARRKYKTVKRELAHKGLLVAVGR